MELSPLLTHNRSKPLFSLQNPSIPAKFNFHGIPKIPSSDPCRKFNPPPFGFTISHKKHLQSIQKPQRRKPISAIFERFTERAIKAVMFSQREAKHLGDDMVLTHHLLLGLVAEDRSPNGYLGSGITVEMARDEVRRIWNGKDSSESYESATAATDIAFSVRSKLVFEAAVEYSKNLSHNFVAPEHISIGLFTVDDGNARRVLESLGVNMDNLATIALSRLHGELANDGREPSSGSNKIDKKFSSGKIAVVKSSNKMEEKSVLAQFCVDLTARASDGLIDPVIGRESEVQRIVEILCRRTKNNPILLGEAGVGKTAIAEGLAIKISNGDVPIFLSEKRIMSLDIGLLIAGSMDRGELEARLTGLIGEILKKGNIILFIDEVHTIIGSGTVGKGNKGSGLDVANLLKPALGRGKLQVLLNNFLRLDDMRVLDVVYGTPSLLLFFGLENEKALRQNYRSKCMYYERKCIKHRT